jgi:4a-hydroxytetrahydrobiopterin dehydratase
MMQVLSDGDVDARLAALPGWTREARRIRRTYEFDGFAAAIAFVNRVAGLAESQDHHPDILIEYRRVTLTLSSHDAGGITARDLRLAAAIDS